MSTSAGDTKLCTCSLMKRKWKRL